MYGELFWLLVGFLLFGHIAASFWTVVMEQKEPASSLVWIILLIFLPGLGMLLYLTFGRRMKRRFRRRLSVLPAALSGYCSSAGELAAVAGQQKDLFLDVFFMNIARHPLTRGNRIRLLNDAQAFYPELFRCIEAARHHVYLEFYVFRKDGVGRELLELLARKAAQGVDVRLLADGIGSWGLKGKASASFEEAGGRLLLFFPPKLRPLATARLNYRNHRKLCCIDGTTAFTGGINIGDEYLGKDPGIGPWRDLQLMVSGPSLAFLEKVFVDDWMLAGGEPLKVRPEAPAEEQDTLVQILPSGPSMSTGSIHEALFQAIASSKKKVYITTPYFIPDQAIRMALRAAGKRGVDIRLLLPQRSNLALVHAAGRSYYPELLNAGVRIFEYSAGFIHAKTMVVDTALSSIGSANMDVRSFHLNFELNIMVYDTALSAELEQTFLADQAQAKEILLREFQARPLHCSFLENSARLFSPLL